MAEREFRDYIAVVRRRRGVIILVTLVVVAAALVASLLQTPVYEARGDLLLQPRKSDLLFDPAAGFRTDPNRALQTEIRALESKPVEDLVLERLGSLPRISAKGVGQTDVIAVYAKSTDPEAAAAAVNAYASAYIDIRRQEAVDDLIAAGAVIQKAIAEVKAQMDALDARVAEAPTDAARELVAESVAPEREGLAQQQSFLKQKLSQLQVDADLTSGGARVIRPAIVPSDPVTPTPVRDGIVAALAGLVAAIGLVLLIEHLDDSIKTKDDLDRALPGVSVVGLIPKVAGWKSRSEPQVVSAAEPTSPAAEAYRTLRTAIQFLELGRPTGLIEITSPNAMEGKTTTLANLAVAVSRAGQRVLMVCCDLRRPRIHEFFGLSNKVGLTSVLLGSVAPAEAIQAVPDMNRLFVLASGPLPPNPSEILSTPPVTELLRRLKRDYDVVLIDSPPVLPVTDSLVLARVVDSVLLVCSARETRRGQAARAVELLRQVDAPLAGVVLNGVTSESSYGYGYEYRYYGGSNGDRARRAKSPAPERARSSARK
jgi:capsular exopolysaccharide synthesis family protein